MDKNKKAHYHKLLIMSFFYVFLFGLSWAGIGFLHGD